MYIYTPVKHSLDTKPEMDGHSCCLVGLYCLLLLLLSCYLCCCVAVVAVVAVNVVILVGATLYQSMNPLPRFDPVCRPLPPHLPCPPWCGLHPTFF